MTKHILRLVVTVIILGAIGLCLWFFVFKPSDSETVFSILEEVEDYKDTSLYSERINTIMSYDNTGYYNPETLTERERIFGSKERIIEGTGEKSFYNEYYYQKIMNSFDKIYDIYSSYVLLAENVSKDQLRQIKKCADEYKSAISAVSNAAEKVIEYEKICVSAGSSQEGLKTELSKRYTVLKDAYKAAFESYYNLIVNVQAIAKEKTFNGEFVYDAHTSYLDLMLLFDSNLIKVKSDEVSDIKLDSVNKIVLTYEQTALKKACIVADAYEERASQGNLAWVDSVGNIEVLDFLNAYIDAASKYEADIKLVADYRFDFIAIDAIKNFNSQSSGDADLEAGSTNGYKASNVNKSAFEDIKKILTFCGIMD